MSGGVTTNYGLAKPTFNTKPWDGIINGNFDLIDAILYTITQIPNIAGMWKNSTQYTAGQNVLDPVSLVFYQCVTTNVSAATGSFAADRIANPTYWAVTNAGQGSIRYDQGQVLTSGQVLQALNNLNAFAYFVRYDAAQTLTTPQLQQILTNLSSLSTAQMIAKFVQFDAVQTLVNADMVRALTNLGLIVGQVTLSGSQQDYLRLNVNGATAQLSPSSTTLLSTTDIDKDISATGVTTLTMPAAPNAWRSGIISNDNPLTGLVTLAVPTGATLDGTLNGTTVLFPFQRARIKQTGPTAYKTDWVDRAPLIAVQNIVTLVASADFNLPDGYTKFRVELGGLLFSTSGAALGARLSATGAAGVKAGAADYLTQRSAAFGTTSQGALSIDTLLYILTNINAASGMKPNANFVLTPGASGQLATILGQSVYVDTTPQAILYAFGGYYNGGTSGAIGRANLLRITPSTGLFGGNISIWGEP